jgi:hypothetical protein
MWSQKHVSHNFQGTKCASWEVIHTPLCRPFCGLDTSAQDIHTQARRIYTHKRAHTPGYLRNTVVDSRAYTYTYHTQGIHIIPNAYRDRTLVYCRLVINNIYSQNCRNPCSNISQSKTFPTTHCKCDKFTKKKCPIKHYSDIGSQKQYIFLTSSKHDGDCSTGLVSQFEFHPAWTSPGECRFLVWYSAIKLPVWFLNRFGWILRSLVISSSLANHCYISSGLKWTVLTGRVENTPADIPI